MMTVAAACVVAPVPTIITTTNLALCGALMTMNAIVHLAMMMNLTCSNILNGEGEGAHDKTYVSCII